jgi:hypothetical protein
MHNFAPKLTRTPKAEPVGVLSDSLVGQRQQTGNANHSDVSPSFGHDFSRIPVTTTPAALVQAKVYPDSAEHADSSSPDSSVVDTATGYPEEGLSLSERLKLYKYRRKLKRLQRRTTLTGERLKTEMDRQYQYEAWYYVPLGGFAVTAVNGWSPISDVAETTDVSLERTTGTTQGTLTSFWLETTNPLVIALDDSVGTITLSLIHDLAYPDVVSATQAGQELARRTVKTTGDKPTFAYDAANGDTIQLTLESHPENIRHAKNLIADPSKGLWGYSKFQVTVRREPPPRRARSMPRIITFSGPLRQQLKKLKQASAPPLTK